jgi:hypothetical protein
MKGDTIVALRIYDSDIKNKSFRIYFVKGVEVIPELTAVKLGLAVPLHIDYDPVHGLTTFYYKLSSDDISILLVEQCHIGTYHFTIYGPADLELLDFEKEGLLAELQKKSERVRKILQSSTDPDSSPSSSRSS